MSLERSDLAARARKVLSPVLGHYTWLPIERGEGSFLFTSDGRRILDLTCGIAVMAVGHGHPRVVAAVERQARKLLHINTGVAKYEANVAFAEALAAVTPPGLDTVFFANSGAEAVEAAIKFVRSVTRRDAIVAFRGGFHGRTTGAAALTTSKAHYREGVGPLLPEVYVSTYPYRLRCGHEMERRRRTEPFPGAASFDRGHSAEECAERSLTDLERLFAHEVPPQNVAACVVEPVLGEGGYAPAPASFLAGLREITRRHGILLVFDEVQTGFGRTGAMFAALRCGVVPDAMLLAKALGGGLPLGALVAPRELHERWVTGTHGSTFGGNPVSCAAGLATLQVIREEGLAERAEVLGQVIAEELAPLRSDARVGEIRRLGAMVGVEFVDASGAPDKAAAKAAIAGALERDVLLITCGAQDQVVRFVPPLNIAEDDLRRGVRAFVEAVRQPIPAHAR